MIKTCTISFYGQLTRRVFASPSRRFFSSKGVPVITKTELEELIKSKRKDYVLIDVREHREVDSTGLIPTAHHVPLAKLYQGLNIPRDWEANFGFRLPKKTDILIFYCKLGGRSHSAAVEAQSKGYINVKNYVGSAKEWFYSEK